MSDTAHRIQLADTQQGPERTTATLLASLQARMTALYLVSGADAVASITAGMARLGRQVSETAEGMRLRRALESSRSAMNGRAVWNKLRLSEWTCGILPTPVLEQLHNDVAILLADDVDVVLQALPLPAEMVGPEGTADTPDVDFVDVAIGLWAFSRELTHCIEDLAAPHLPPRGSFGPNGAAPMDGSILR
ncbi:MAG: hypothetical protein ACKV2U_17310 [Bryobacteraceae bacterium]